MTLAFARIPHPASLLQDWDPRWKLAALGVAAFCAAAVQSLLAAGVALTGSAVLLCLGRVPARWYGARLADLMPFLLFFVFLTPWLTIDREPLWQWGPVALSGTGLRLALLVSMKTLALVSLAAVLLTSAPTAGLLHAAHHLRVPGVMIQIALLSYRYVFLFADELARIRVALRVRAYRNRATLHSYRTVAHVLGTLLVRSQDRAERVGQAMHCRGFDGRFRSLAEFHTRGRDLAWSAGVSAVFLGMLGFDIWLRTF